jgi:hypothetical protein
VNDSSGLERAAGVCPIIDIDYREDRAAFWNFTSLNEVRETAPIVYNRTPHRGYWMVTRYDEVKEALQRPDVFTNDLVSALGDPTATCGYCRRTSTRRSTSGTGMW